MYIIIMYNDGVRVAELQITIVRRRIQCKIQDDK